MTYQSVGFLLAFLPLTAGFYQLVKREYRWAVLLIASLVFCWSWSRFLSLYAVLISLLTYYAGKYLSSLKGKENKQKKKRVLHILIVLLLLGLGVFKYSNWIIDTVNHLFSLNIDRFNLIAPIGISYFTLQAISYLCDVKNRKYEPCDHIGKLMLYLVFFPTVVQGPIARFQEIECGNDITASNLRIGFERIVWGLFQKLVIADHLAMPVNLLFDKIPKNGFVSLMAAVLCTIQLYMDFKGCTDIAIGAAYIFGITLPENFRQPFSAKNAGDFWRRWHMTLGRFFRDYIFYPVSLSRPVMKLSLRLSKDAGKKAGKYSSAVIALLCVWLANGLWHGPSWTYVGYGLYYFVLMVMELFFEKPFEAWAERHPRFPLKAFRLIKLMIIVMIGEMFFRAPSFMHGWKMLMSMIFNMNAREGVRMLRGLGMDSYDMVTVFLGFAFVMIVDILKEKNVDLNGIYRRQSMAVRFALLYALIFAVIIFGAYGPGFGKAGMMYAGF